VNKPARTASDDCSRNPDPITKAPGSHPLGTGVGGIAGADGGAAVGALFGPIGLIVGGIAGTIAGAAAGHGAAEALDPTCELEYWREEHPRRLGAANDGATDANADYERDWWPAYRYGSDSRSRIGRRAWDDDLDRELSGSWSGARKDSTLDWQRARPAVQAGWERADRTFDAYDESDGYFRERFERSEFREPGRGFDDYRNAYRYGLYARSSNPDRQWDDTLERELAPGWQRARGGSPLEWDQARHAAREGWDRVQSGTAPDLR
jgi:hypothetical protein